MTVWDPLRRIEIAATPEEQVRQWFISELRNTFHVPVDLMMSEVGFKFGSKQYRADILVYDRQARPLCVVECKRPSVEISPAVVDQAMRYNAVLSVRYIILTNGNNTYLYTRKGDRFAQMDHIPVYDEMLCQQ
ncbi:MAG: type I restriction enzyme HsdR N-terminal domain-containing protein [Bacteroidales bacterium]|nr:type I restriction enzyme HsdR N-terminal domain-containing protein [Bacteroidales bacterium]